MKRYRRLVMVVLLIISSLASAIPVQAAANDGATKKSLMIQVSTVKADSEDLYKTKPNVFTRAELLDSLNAVCNSHRDSTKDDYIYDLVLQDIASESSAALNTSVLDIIAPFFPGGSKVCGPQSRSGFDNLFVGTVDVTWKGVGGTRHCGGVYELACPSPTITQVNPIGSPYLEGIADSYFRWENILKSEAAANAFVARYPSTYVNWYVTLEANLNVFDAQYQGLTIAKYYEAYLTELVKRLNGIRSNRATLWSPNLWLRYSQTSPTQRASLKAALDPMFANIKSGSNGIGISWLHFQDHMGDTLCSGFTTSDAKNWRSFLSTVSPSFASLRVNMEQYRVRNCSAPTVLDPMTNSEKRSVEDWYEANGVPVGASWDIRFWFPNRTDL